MNRIRKARLVVVIGSSAVLFLGIIFFLYSIYLGKDRFVIRREYGLIGVSEQPTFSLMFEAYAVGSREYDKFQESSCFKFDDDNIVINNMEINHVGDMNDIAVCSIYIEAKLLNPGDCSISELIYEYEGEKTKYDIGDIEIVYSDLEGRLPHVHYSPYIQGGSETKLTLQGDEGFVITGILTSEKYPVRMIGRAYRSVNGEEVEVSFVPEFSVDEGDVMIYRPMLFMTTEAGAQAVVSLAWTFSDKTEMTEEQVKEYIQ